MQEALHVGYETFWRQCHEHIEHQFGFKPSKQKILEIITQWIQTATPT
jgi:hypothetical protein